MKYLLLIFLLASCVTEQEREINKERDSLRIVLDSLDCAILKYDGNYELTRPLLKQRVKVAGRRYGLLLDKVELRQKKGLKKICCD